MLGPWQTILAAISLAVVGGWLVVCAYSFLAPRVVAWRRMLHLAGEIPGPPALPILGNALMFMARPEELLTLIAELFEKYGQYVRIWLGPELNVCIKNPHDIRMLLTSNKISCKGPLYDLTKTYIGPGILSGGKTWRNHRKIATPSYNKKSVSKYIEVFNKETKRLADVLSTRESTFDVYLDVVHCTTQSVCQTLMGLSEEESNNVKRMKELVYITQTMYTFMFIKMTRWWLQIPFIFWITGRKKQEDYYVKLIKDVASDFVEKRMRALEKNPNPDEEAMGVVDRFIMSGELSQEELIFEAFTLFTTSQEALAKIASGVLLFLAHLPEWQDKVYNEIIEVLGPNDDDVTEEELKKMQYLDMVFKETLRYLSIAAFIQRTVEDEVAIKDGQLTLPKGSSVIFPIQMLHRDPKYWEHPNKVDPGRFLPENVKKRDPNAFVPFSLGVMDCLGRVYATSLIKTLVVHVVRRLHLAATGRLEDLELHVAISVKFAKGYHLRATPRQLKG